jgi:hypothetical protein
MHANGDPCLIGLGIAALGDTAPIARRRLVHAIGHTGTEPRRLVASAIGQDAQSLGRDPVNNPGGAGG